MIITFKMYINKTFPITMKYLMTKNKTLGLGNGLRDMRRRKMVDKKVKGIY